MHGLIHNLTVVEQLADNGENSGKYEVVAGGRRFAALQRLAKQKKVPTTFAVPCHVVDPATATETSLAENRPKISGSANFRKYGNIRSEVFQWAKPIRICMKRQ